MSPEVLNDLLMGAQQDSPLRGKWDASWECLASTFYTVHSRLEWAEDGAQLMSVRTSGLCLVIPLPSHPAYHRHLQGPLATWDGKCQAGERDLKGGRNRTADGHVGPAKDGEKSRALGWQRNTPKNGFHMLREEYWSLLFTGGSRTGHRITNRSETGHTVWNNI